jgi:hypothetical protein
MPVLGLAELHGLRSKLPLHPPPAHGTEQSNQATAALHTRLVTNKTSNSCGHAKAN